MPLYICDDDVITSDDVVRFCSLVYISFYIGKILHEIVYSVPGGCVVLLCKVYLVDVCVYCVKYTWWMCVYSVKCTWWMCVYSVKRTWWMCVYSIPGGCVFTV